MGALAVGSLPLRLSSQPFSFTIQRYGSARSAAARSFHDLFGTSALQKRTDFMLAQLHTCSSSFERRSLFEEKGLHLVNKPRDGTSPWNRQCKFRTSKAAMCNASIKRSRSANHLPPLAPLACCTDAAVSSSGLASLEFFITAPIFICCADMAKESFDHPNLLPAQGAPPIAQRPQIEHAHIDSYTTADGFPKVRHTRLTGSYAGSLLL